MVSTLTIALLALSLSTTPIAGGALTITRVDVNTSIGDQTDPHVDGDLAAYTSRPATGPVQEIRYYRFPAGPDLAVPTALPDGGFATDYLSDVDQGRIAFTRQVPGGPTAIMLFDTVPATPTLTEVAPQAGSRRIGVALGGPSIVFSDQGFDGQTGEMVHFDLQSQLSTRLTTDSDNDQNPAVSPDGQVLVWEKCPGTSIFGSCQVLQSRWDGTQWLTSVVATAPSSNPDTNGTLVVYEGTRSGSLTSTDIFTRAVAGGGETALEIAGLQRNPSIRGSIIAFESRADGSFYSDILLYDLASNRLFQVTATPTINENLNDVTVLPNGDVRVVWVAQDEADEVSGNIYAATFTLPADPNGGTGGGAGGGMGGGGGSGGGAGGGAGGGSGCTTPRSSTLVATRYFSPTRWDDGDATFSPAFAFALPAEIPVTAGNSGNHWVRLTLTTTAGYQTMCRYRGGASTAHPQDPAQIAAGLKYSFEFCTGQGMALHAGDRVEVTRAQLRVDGGDSWQPLTTVSLTLTELCAQAQPCTGSGHGHHDEDGDGDHDEDDHRGDGHNAQSPEPVGSTEQGLEGEPVPAMGCSSTSGGLAWPALMLVLAFVALQRRGMPIRVAQAQERRRLRR